MGKMGGRRREDKREEDEGDERETGRMRGEERGR